MTRGFHVAQINIARVRAPVDSPELADFVAQLDPINALADRSEGFVWRLQTEDGNATALRPYDDERILVNMSAWESVESLGAFVYETRHLDVLRRRKEWFELASEAYLALWWVAAGTIPTIDEAKQRLEHLRENGPTPHAFTLKIHFPPPGTDGDLVEDERWPCPVG